MNHGRTRSALRDARAGAWRAARSCSIRPIAGGSIRAHSWPPRGSICATLRRSEDSFVDELVAGVVPRGYPLMRAHFPRCYVDVNREPYELDPRMFDGRLPSFANTRSMRVAGGLGTVARVVGDAQEIYDQRISVDDALQRIESLYKPYHRALRRLFSRVHRDFGAAMLIDCHSMPSAAGAATTARAPISCSATATARAASRWCRRRSRPRCAALGYTVSRNKPYAGGFITEHYGNPAAGPARDPARDQPRALHGREALRAHPVVRALAADLETLADRLARDPDRGVAALPRGRRVTSCPMLQSSIPFTHAGRLARCRRPKSREETPKEGGGSTEISTLAALQQ